MKNILKTSVPTLDFSCKIGLNVFQFLWVRGSSPGGDAHWPWRLQATSWAPQSWYSSLSVTICISCGSISLPWRAENKIKTLRHLPTWSASWMLGSYKLARMLASVPERLRLVGHIRILHVRKEFRVKKFPESQQQTEKQGWPCVRSHTVFSTD